jgi:RNA polymerase sigma-70 factor (ECF subfamily)
MKAVSQQSDAALIEQFKQGNKNALNILFSRHQERIYQSIYYKLKDKHLAEDIMQEVFIRIFNNLNKDSYLESGKFLSWAITIASNMVIDYKRKINTMPFTMPLENLHIAAIDTVDCSTETKRIKKETEQYLIASINKLPAAQREVVVLKLYGELTFKTIGALTNTSINTALGRMQYAIKNMKKIVLQREMAA